MSSWLAEASRELLFTPLPLQVVVRVRPPLPREMRGTGLRPYQCTTHVEPSGRIITLSENLPAVLQVGCA